jgi:hypothetical protein
MKVGRFGLHRPAFMALGQLTAVDQSAIMERLASLSDLPPGLARASPGDRTWLSHSTWYRWIIA